jgi:AcrR family transcriptional regulator
MVPRKKIIIQKSLLIFLNNGIKPVSMDNIAKELSISKKTLYQYFSSKDDLLKNCIDYLKTIMPFTLKQLRQNDISTSFKLYIFFNFAAEIMKNISNNFLYDLSKFYPDIWEDINKFRTDFLNSFFLKEYKKGVKEGCFKKYEPIIITQIFVSSVKNIINPEFILNNNISADKALKETINFIFNSLLTEKGAAEFNGYKSMKNNFNNYIKNPFKEFL